MQNRFSIATIFSGHFFLSNLNFLPSCSRFSQGYSTKWSVARFENSIFIHSHETFPATLVMTFQEILVKSIEIYEYSIHSRARIKCATGWTSVRTTMDACWLFNRLHERLQSSRDPKIHDIYIRVVPQLAVWDFWPGFARAEFSLGNRYLK